MGYIEKRIGFATDKGNNRDFNEDAVVCFANKRDESDVDLLVGIADGMGGHSQESMASSFVASELELLFRRQEYKNFAAALETNEKNLPYIYKMALLDINERLNKKISETGKKEVSTTFTGALGFEMELYLAHAGDSRAYCIRGGRCSQLTEEHIIINKLSKIKKINPNQTLPKYFYLLYRSLGAQPWLKLDYKVLKVEPNDVYVFCSDGFYNFVDEKAMLHTMMKLEYAPQPCAEALVNLAKEKGSTDNISVACILYLNVMGLEMSNIQSTTRFGYS